MTPPEEDIILDAPADQQGEDNDSSESTTPKMSLEVKIDSTGDCARHITVTISRGDVDRYFNEAFGEMMPKANVPGFRPGRAPRKLVENRFRKEVSGQVKGSLLMDSMAQVAEEQDFSAIGEPDFDYESVEIPEEGPLTFEFDLEVRPDFDVPDWKGLRIERPTQKFGKTEIDAHLLRVLQRQAQLVAFAGAAEAGDYVTLNMNFTKDGKSVSSVNEQVVCVRPSLSFPDAKLDDFDKLMEGVKAGDTVETKIVLSEGAFNEDLRGQEVNVQLDVVEVQRQELPEITDSLLEQMGGFETEGDLRDAVQQELERQLAYEQQRGVRQQITSLLTKAADWDLPDELLKRQSQRELDRAVMELRSSGFSDEQIQAHENDLSQNSMSSTATALKEHFILERIAEDREIEAEDADYDREIGLIAYQSGDQARRVRARLEKRGLMDSLRNQIVERKVIDLITAEAEFTDVAYVAPRDEVEALSHVVGGEEEKEIPQAKYPGEEKTTDNS